MGKKLTDDILRWTLDINGKPAIKELGILEQQTKSLKDTNKDLRLEMQKLEAAGKKGSSQWNNLKNQITANNRTIKINEQRMAGLRKEIGLNGLTAKQLRSEYRRLKNQMDNTTPGTADWKKYNRQLKAVETQLGQVRSGTQRANKVFGTLKTLLPIAGFAALAASIRKAWNNAVETRKEFSRYEAVLKVALGSQKLANKEFDKLQKFAATTPFQLNELTGAYVKLTNYGLRPNMEEMRNYGDLASSVGKGFDQLVEAVADATQFEFERLKEFGIRAQKEGDKVKFTFKGITTEVDANAQSVKNYLAGLGSLQGVANSMDEISKTIGGAMSNAGDSTDSLFNAIGKRLEPSLVKLFGTYSRVTGAITRFIEASPEEQIIKEREEVNRLSTVLINSNESLETRNAAYERLKEINPDIVEGIKTEKVETEFLWKNVAEYNKQAAQKILLAGLEEKRQKLLAKQTRATSKIMDAQKEILMATGKIVTSSNVTDKIRELGEAFSEAVKENDAEKINSTYKEFAKEVIKTGGEVKDALIDGYGTVFNDLKAANAELDFQIRKNGDVIAGLEKEKAILEDILGLNKEVNEVEDNKGGSNVDPTTLNKKYQESIESLRNYFAETDTLTLEEADKFLDEEAKKAEAGLDITKQKIADEIAMEAEKNAEIARQREEDYREAVKKAEKLKGIAYNYTMYVGSLLSQALNDGKLTLDEALRIMTLAILKGLKQTIQAAQFRIWANAMSTYDSVMTLGASGAIRAGIMMGLVEAAFRTAEQALLSGMNQRARGKYTVTGADDGRVYRDIPFTNVTESGIPNGGQPTIINEHGGEYILTAPHVQNLQINYPALLNAIHATRVPQRAEGNYPTQVQAVQQSVPYDQLVAVLAETREELRRLQTNGVKGKWYLNELQDAESELNDIENIASGR